jgi:hypothetical protein
MDASSVFLTLKNATVLVGVKEFIRLQLSCIEFVLSTDLPIVIAVHENL